MTIGIYCIEHMTSGKKYIGQSSNIEQRIWTQRYILRSLRPNKKNVNRHLLAAVKEHGISEFKFYILEEHDHIDRLHLKNREAHWMDVYKTRDRNYGYNLRKDDYSGMHTHDETRVLHSVNFTGRGNPNFGNNWTNAQKERASLIQKERWRTGAAYCSEDARRKISLANKQMWKNADLKKQMAEKVSIAKRKYIFGQYSREGVLIRYWGSVKEIIEANPDYKWQNIYSVCNGYKNTYMNYVWKKFTKEEHAN